MVDESRNHVDYLIGGLRISLEEDSGTPGPRSHILNVVNALENAGRQVTIYQANKAPGLKRLAGAPEGGGARRPSLGKRIAIDLVRLVAAFWTSAWMLEKTRHSTAPIVYERAAVMQNLTAFHRNRSRAVKIVESNGIMSIETAVDRNASALGPISRAIERRLYRQADLVVAVSQPLAEAICSFAGIQRSKVLVVPNAVPSDLINIDVISPEVFRVGFMGAVVPWQRVDVLLRGAALARSLGSIEIRVVGEGESVDELRRLVTALRLDAAVTFTGRLNRRDAITELSTWSVGYAGHVATSHEHMYHSPLKIYEYAALGMHIIATDYPDARSLEQDGSLVSIIEKPEDVAKAIDIAFLQWKSGGVPSGSAAQDARRHNTWEARVASILRCASILRSVETVAS